MNYDPNRSVPMATVLGIAWAAFAAGMLAAAALAVATRPTITVTSAAATTTTTAAVEVAAPATTIRRTTTAKPTTTTTTEAPPTTRYVPPPTAPPTIDQATSEAIQRLALETTFQNGDMSVAELCDGIDMVGLDLAVDTFMRGANESPSSSDFTFDRWVVEDYFTDTCGI